MNITYPHPLTDGLHSQRMKPFWHAGLHSTLRAIALDIDNIKATTHSNTMKLSELNSHLAALGSQLDKAKGEIVAEVQSLKDALASTDIPADAQASLDALTAKAQALDDLNPDVPPAPPAA